VKSVLLNFAEQDRKIFWVFVVFFIISLALYIYFLGVSVVAVIERKGAEHHSAALTASIMTLESRYVALSKQIDLTLAHEHGFVDVVNPVYITANQGKSFSLRTSGE
jgi:hypothetical protein